MPVHVQRDRLYDGWEKRREENFPVNCGKNVRKKVPGLPEIVMRAPLKPSIVFHFFFRSCTLFSILIATRSSGFEVVPAEPCHYPNLIH